MGNNARAAHADGEMLLSERSKETVLNAVADIDKEKAEWLKAVKFGV